MLARSLSTTLASAKTKLKFFKFEQGLRALFFFLQKDILWLVQMYKYQNEISNTRTNQQQAKALLKDY